MPRKKVSVKPVRARRISTKDPIKLAEMAMELGEQSLAPYSCKQSRHDFTQGQLFAVLVLKSFFAVDYRGMTVLLDRFSELRRVLKLKHLPSYSTLCYAQKRILEKKDLRAFWKQYSKKQPGLGCSEITIWV